MSMQSPEFTVPTQVAAVLFDLDGTLVHTAPDFSDVLQQLCLQAGIAAPSEQAVHATVSSGARALVKLAFDREPGDPDFEPLLTELLERYFDRIQQTQSALYPNMAALLATLAGRDIPWGVVTNKPVRFSEPLMRSLGLHEQCAVLICPDHVSRSKPDPEPLLLACKQLGVSPKQCIYVGDHPRDIDAGRAAGMHTVAAGWGYLPPEPPIEQWQADFIAGQVIDLANHMGQHEQHKEFS